VRNLCWRTHGSHPLSPSAPTRASSGYTGCLPRRNRRRIGGTRGCRESNPIWAFIIGNQITRVCLHGAPLTPGLTAAVLMPQINARGIALSRHRLTKAELVVRLEGSKPRLHPEALQVRAAPKSNTRPSMQDDTPRPINKTGGRSSTSRSTAVTGWLVKPHAPPQNPEIS